MNAPHIPFATAINLDEGAYAALVTAYKRSVVKGIPTVPINGTVILIEEAEAIIQDMHDILNSDAYAKHNLVLAAAGFP